jgi:hypothetical protein
MALLPFGVVGLFNAELGCKKRLEFCLLLLCSGNGVGMIFLLISACVGAVVADMSSGVVFLMTSLWWFVSWLRGEADAVVVAGSPSSIPGRCCLLVEMVVNVLREGPIEW